MSKSYYQSFLKEVQELLIENFARQKYPGDWLIEETMAKIRGICENYGVDWQIEP